VVICIKIKEEFDMKKMFLFCTLIFVLLFTACAPSVPLGDYEIAVSMKDSIQSDFDALSSKMTLLQDEHGLLTSTHNALTTEKATLQNEYDTLRNEYDTLRSEASGFFALNEAERESALEVAKREYEISGLDARVYELNAEIGILNGQIAELQASVVRIAGESRTFPAGFFVAGEDFEVGRYRIYGGSSNFFVRDRTGRSRVNIIFGSRASHVTEYIYRFASGDEIESRSSFRMVPIE